MNYDVIHVLNALEEFPTGTGVSRSKRLLGNVGEF
jgi:hypothetical protein